MADILKVTTPLVDRLPQNNAARPVVDPSAPFNLSDVTRVIQTTYPSELLQQNTGFVPEENGTPSILTDLLKDPAVTASVIRNIALLEEVINLLPANNTALSQEVEQLFSELMLSPEQLVAELKNQEQSTTLFKGDLFNQLREILAQAKTMANQPEGVPPPQTQAPATGQAAEPGRLTAAEQLRAALLNPPSLNEVSSKGLETATGVGVLLKALNATISRRDVLDSVANNLTYLANNVKTSPTLYEKLTSLINGFRSESAPENFPELKHLAMGALEDVERSILFTPQMEKTVSLAVYNLSRYNPSDDFLPNALRLLLSNMDNVEEKEALVQKLQAFIDKNAPTEGARTAREAEDDSQVMNALSKIIDKNATTEELRLLSGDRLEKIVHSMLSSPSNFTPLMHFILPLEVEDMRAFAEIWMEHADETDENGKGKGAGGGTGGHMLMVFDVDDIGRFENDMYITGKKLSMNLSCPPAYTEAFQSIGPAIRRAISGTGYTIDEFTIGPLTKNHSLMEVFKDLPYRRTGIDVKV